MKPYQKSIFGQLRNEDIFRFTFENDLGYRLSVMNYGATILEYQTPDKTGHFANVILRSVEMAQEASQVTSKPGFLTLFLSKES